MIKVALVSWLLPFSLSVSESPLPHQGAFGSEGYPQLHSRIDGMYVPTSVPEHRPPGVGITAEVTVLGEYSLLALVVGKEAARPGLSQPIWFSSLARSLEEPGPAPARSF